MFNRELDGLEKLRNPGNCICIVAPKGFSPSPFSKGEEEKEKGGLQHSNLQFHTFNNRTIEFNSYKPTENSIHIF